MSAAQSGSPGEDRTKGTRNGAEGNSATVVNSATVTVDGEAMKAGAIMSEVEVPLRCLAVVKTVSVVEGQPEPAGEATTEAAGEAAGEASQGEPSKVKRGRNFGRVLAYGVLPGLAFLLAVGAGLLTWQDSLARDSVTASAESLAAAKDSTVALLSYRPDTVEKDLDAARSRLTGDFQNSYTSLINDVVIPGAKQKQITAVASVPAAASVSATPSHAVTLVFVNQTTTVGTGAPTGTDSSVKVTLDKIGGRWLIALFEPI